MSFKYIILPILTICCLSLCGCSASTFSPTTEKIPERESINAERDYTYHEKVSSLPTMPTKQLDPDFINQYINEDKFYQNAIDVEENMGKTRQEGAGAEEAYRVALNEVETAKRDQEHYSDLQVAIKDLEGKMLDMIQGRTKQGHELLD